MESLVSLYALVSEIRISGFMVGGGAFRLPLPNGARVNKYIVNAMRISFLFQHFGSK